MNHLFMTYHFSCLFACRRYDTMWVFLHYIIILKIIMLVLNKQVSGFWDHVAMLECSCIVQLIDTNSLTVLLALSMIWTSSAGATLSLLRDTSLCNRDMLGGILIKCRHLQHMWITTVFPVNGEKQLFM